MSLAQALISYAASGGDDPSGILEALAAKRRAEAAEPRAPRRHQAPAEVDRPDSSHSHTSYPTERVAGALVLPTSFRSSHMTSGLGWPAVDIMAAAGTPVGAPEPGVVKYWHPEGAQGGGSILFDPTAPGPDYWLGHLDAGVPGGTRIKRRGQQIAVVSSRHPRPHVHEARQR